MSYYTANVKLYESSSGAIDTSGILLAYNVNDTVPDSVVTANSLLTTGKVTLQTGPGTAPPEYPVTVIGAPTSGQIPAWNTSTHQWEPGASPSASYAALPSGSTAGTAVLRKTRRAVYGSGSTGNLTANTSITEAVYRVPGRLPQTPTRIRLNIRNIDTLAGTAYTGALSFTGLWVGDHLYDASGNWTGKTSAAPTSALGAFSTPADGSTYTSAWITDATVLAHFARGNPFVLSLGFTNAGGQSHARGSGVSFVVTGAGKSLIADQAAPSGLASAGGAVLWDLWLEYDYDGNTPAIFVPGDSLSEGVQATHGTQDSWPEHWARKNGTVAVTAGVGSATTTLWTSMTGHNWTKYQFGTVDAPAVDAVALLIGSNDLGNSVSAATIEANIGTIIGNLRTTFGSAVPIWLCTIPPRNLSAANEANRQTVNAWIRGQPWDVAGIIDFDAAVRDDPMRGVVDGGTTSGSPTVTSATANFQPADVGQAISGAGIPANSFIGVVNSTTSIGLSSTQGTNTAVNATATATGVTLTIGGPTALHPAYAYTDGIHMKSGGYARMATQCGSMLSPVALS